jgi:hypothetical protein
MRNVLLAALLLAACGSPASTGGLPSPTLAATPPPVPTPTLEPTKPPFTQQPLPLPTRVRFAVDLLARAPDRPLLVLFADGYASGYHILDSAGNELVSVPIAGSGIFGPETCVSKEEQPHEFVTWAGVDESVLAKVLAAPRSYRVIADGIPSGQVTLALIDSACRSEPRYLTQAEAWEQVRAALPSFVPVSPPAWLPASIDLTRVNVDLLGNTAQHPHFTVIYRGTKGIITYTLGEYPQIDGSSIGIRVRGVPGSLAFDQSLWNDPGGEGLRRVRWVEGAYTFTFDTSSYSGDDLLHMAWSLPQYGAPPPAKPVDRSARYVCAKTGASPEDTVRVFLALIGDGDRAAISDCFTSWIAAEWSMNEYASDLPRVTTTDVRRIGEVGGRPVIGATWSFASDPGGAWGPSPVSRFLTLGLEDGVWRVQDMGTAAIGPPP